MIEHIAFNVFEPSAMSLWYARYFALKILRQDATAPYVHFLADETGMMVEFYHNPIGAVPSYAEQSPYTLHLAFKSSDLMGDIERLKEAGATQTIGIQHMANGDKLVFMRDPWGFNFQLCQRKSF
ncbi:MAG: VOC family protein [Deinococcales bacterium]